MGVQFSGLEALTPATQEKLRPRCGRKPLQPKNDPANQIPDHNNVFIKEPNPKQVWIDISPIQVSNKENHPVYSTPKKAESLDASLAEELSAIKKKLERLKLDRERTEKLLSDRGTVFEMWKKEVQQRGEIQKKMEMEVDRLFRLKELRARCMEVSPIRSLREKEQEKKVHEIVQIPLQVKREEIGGKLGSNSG